MHAIIRATALVGVGLLLAPACGGEAGGGPVSADAGSDMSADGVTADAGDAWPREDASDEEPDGIGPPDAGPTWPVGGDDCCVLHDSPSCDDEALVACVCDADPFCCSGQWDPACVEAAEACGGCSDAGPPAEASCTPNHARPAADDGVAACTCDADPWCCEFGWDGACVAAAVAEGCLGCDCDPAGVGPIPCPPADEGCCAPHATAGCTDPVVEACVCADDAFCCDVRWDAQCVVDVVALGCGECTRSCCEAWPVGGCGDEIVQACVCTADAYCCDTAWDGACVDTVDAEGCGTCKPASCCRERGVPGCEDPAVEACACALDGYCCDTAWDDACVELAHEGGCVTCPACCVRSDGEAGCAAEPAIEACVCAQDAYCCDTEWDGQCAANVEAFGCGSCEP